MAEESHSLFNEGELQSTTAPKKGKVLCFVSAKGGSGKTILAVTTASLLMESKKKVLVIDADFSTRGLSLYLLDALTNLQDPEIPPESCLADALLRSIPPENVVPLVVPQRNGDFSILLPNSNFRRGGAPEDKLLRLGRIASPRLPGNKAPTYPSSEQDDPNADFEILYMNLLRSLCNRFRKIFDYIIIDTRGGYDYSNKIPALLADAYVVVIEADPISVQQVFGLKTMIDEFARKVEMVANHKGFIINKALFYTRQSTFADGLSDLFGGRSFGVIPADRNAISAYQTRDIPFQKYAGSDFSYYSSLAVDKLLESVSTFSSQSSPLSTSVTKRIRVAWRFGAAVGYAESVYSVIILTSLLIFLSCFSAYSYGYIWSSVALVFNSGCVLASLAVLMPLVREWTQMRTSGVRSLKAWVLPSVVSVVGAILFALNGPAIRKALTGNLLLAQAKTLNQQVYTLTSQLQNSSVDLARSNDQYNLALLQTEQLKKQLATSQAALVSAQNDVSAAKTFATKLQASSCASTCPPQSGGIQAPRNPPASAVLTPSAGPSTPSAPVQWQTILDRSIQEPFSGDCIDEIRQLAPNCSIESSKSNCFMQSAIASAKHEDFSTAFEIAVGIQCQNPDAAATLKEAGATAVGRYLNTK